MVNTKQVIFFQEIIIKSGKDGGEVCGSRAQFSLCPAGKPSQSSEEQSEQPMESQLILSLEAKDCRRCLKTDSKRVCWLTGRSLGLTWESMTAELLGLCNRDHSYLRSFGG